MSHRNESRLRRPTSKLKPSDPSENIAGMPRRRGVGAVHPNSAAARVWKSSTWLYAGPSNAVPACSTKREREEEELRLRRQLDPPRILSEDERVAMVREQLREQVRRT